MYTPPITIQAYGTDASYTLQYTGVFPINTGSILATKYLNRFIVDPVLEVGDITVEIENQDGTFYTVPFISEGLSLKKMFKDYDNWAANNITPAKYVYNLNQNQIIILVTVLSSTMLALYQSLRSALFGGAPYSFPAIIQIQYPQQGMDGNQDFADGSTVGVYD